VTDELVVELEARLEATPHEVFAHFVDPERYVRWQGVRAELDPRPGGVFRVWIDERTAASGEYVTVEPPDRVVFTWGWDGSAEVPPGSKTVELRLSPDGDETVVSLRHTGLPDASAAMLHEEDWRSFLERLRVAARGEDAGPMPDGSDMR
jgi:uncharacterized protein YndB with AHSA1/START domain